MEFFSNALGSILALPAPWAILISASAATAVAVRAVRTQRKIARQRATLDVLLSGDERIRKAQAVFRDIRDSKDFDRIVSSDSQSSRTKDDRQMVMAFLNYYEVLFCGVMEDTLDELLLFQFARTTVINYWGDCKKYVEDVREEIGNPRAFEMFQHFAESWKDDKFVTRKRKNKQPPYYRSSENRMKCRYFQD